MHLPRKNRTKKMSLLSINLLVNIVDLKGGGEANRTEVKAPRAKANRAKDMIC